MIQPMPWLFSQPKGVMLEAWFLSVMADRDLNAAQVRVAWALTFLFNSKTGKAWAGNEAIGHSTGLTPETVRKAVRMLVQRNHLVRTREPSKGISIRILRPALAHERDIRQVGQGVPPSTTNGRRGGTGRPTQVGQGIPPKPGQGVPHILRGNPLNDPGGVEDMAPDSERPEAEDVFDEEIDLPF